MSNMNHLPESQQAASVGSAANVMPMSRLLMQALVESERAKEPRATLAVRMGVDVQVLDNMIQAFESANGVGSWGQFVVESRIRNDVTAANWDELELEATQRLAKQVKEGKVTRASDLLMIARTANAAARRGAHARVDSLGGEGEGGTMRAGFRLPGGEAVMELRLSGKVAGAIQKVNVEESERFGAPAPAFESFSFTRIETPSELREIADGVLGVDGAAESNDQMDEADDE